MLTTAVDVAVLQIPRVRSRIPAPAVAPVDPMAVLVDSAKAGNRQATEALLTHLRPLIVRYCRARLGTARNAATSADDIAQDVCMAVLKSLPSYRSSGASFLAFVYGIAIHKIADFHRRCTRDKSTPVAELPEDRSPTAGPEQRVMHQEAAKEFAVLLTDLSEAQRQVLILRLIVGLSVAETAEAMSSSAGAVRTCQHRALAKLRRKLSTSPGLLTRLR